MTNTWKQTFRTSSWTMGLLLALSTIGEAQKYVPPPPPLTVDPCAAGANPLLPTDGTAKAQPLCVPVPSSAAATPGPPGGGAAAQFPFPEATAAPATGSGKPAAADQFPFPGNSSTVPPIAPAGKTAGQFPYPGETSKSPDAVPEGDTPRYVPDAPAGPKTTAGDNDSSSSSSSSSSTPEGSELPPALPADSSGGASSDHPGGQAAGSGSRSILLGRRALPKVSAVSTDERVTTDLDVAKFYSDHGNFQAAYLRAKDATKLMPEDSESHFALAQAAEHLQRKDEAAAEYALYLKLDPAGDKTGAARRAMAQLK